MTSLSFVAQNVNLLDKHVRAGKVYRREDLLPYSTSVDRQSVDTTTGGEERGRDNAKNVNGRKRHLV